VIIPIPLVLFAPIDESATTRRYLGECLDIVRNHALCFSVVGRGRPDGGQHDERAIDAFERPLDGRRIVPIAIDQFHALVRPARRFLAIADQRAHFLAVCQQMFCRCAAHLSRDSRYQEHVFLLIMRDGALPLLVQRMSGRTARIRGSRA
jgi:hypothetical protein